MRIQFFVMWLSMAISLPARPIVEASGELSSEARDSGGDTIGGIGSAVAYDPASGQYLCVTDRGPGDGTVPYRPRLVLLTIAQAGERLEISLKGSVILRDESGRPMTGLIPDNLGAAFPSMQDGRTSIDPEALAIAPDGTLYITDEYGPYLYQFTRDGKMIRRMELPEMFRPRTADGKLGFSGEADLVSGRGINQGPEGMCLLDDGKTAAMIFQSGLIQDGGRDSATTKILLMDLATGQATALYDYPFTTQLSGMPKAVKLKNLSVNDMVALDDGTLLVLERDKYGQDGSSKSKRALYKAVWRVALAGATNLLEAPVGTPKLVTKELVLNLPDIVDDPGGLVAKWESICVIPPQQAGFVTFLLGADNDFLTPEVTDDGVTTALPGVTESVPTQFFKVRASLAAPMELR